MTFLHPARTKEGDVSLSVFLIGGADLNIEFMCLGDREVFLLHAMYTAQC